MREILFRGKRKDTSEWTEGLTVFKLDKYVYMCKSSMCEITYDLQHNIKAITSKNPFFVEVIPETVGQYTGLIDRNGTKIFEGDVVHLIGGEFYQGYHEIDENIVVKDITDCVYFGEVELLEIIGNIYDNPEMLGGDENA
ncbi:MAG: YopX family protein [Ruminococcus sp.]|nr:YopX family protein [Ruminococcus sp.]